MLRPETRVSWIAEILPYIGHPDWHVESGYDWNNAHNQPFTKRPLPEVVNPVFGPAASPEGYPVTHYVGVAGVGDDAAQLPADDPRAGVFGYGRQTRLEDLPRGDANTIAIMGVQEQCGPWAQGGRATVRPLSRKPYINGPDGFGSGQPDGMVVGYADGHAGFISKDIDPHVLEQLASVRGGNDVNMTQVEPKPPEVVQPKQAPGPKPPLVPAPKPPVVVKPPEVPTPKLQALLDAPIANMSFANLPLDEVVKTVSEMSSVPVSFDPDALEELRVSLHDPISIDVPKTTIGKALEAIAAKRRMAVGVENGQIVLTSPVDHRQVLQKVNYKVEDLTGGHAQAAADLAALVEKLVVPESWQPAGGPGTLETSPDALLITQTGQVHYRILVFCEKLRVARGLPTRSQLSHSDPKRFALTTRTEKASPILGHVTSINVSLPAPLASILDQFKYPTGTEILIDRPALAAAAISESTAVTCRAEKLSQGEALGKLLDPLELTWRAVDAGTLQVTTAKAAAARRELEFYPVGKLLAAQPQAALIERIKTSLSGAKWVRWAARSISTRFHNA